MRKKSNKINIFIPARSGSQRIKNKHEIKVCGKNILQHTFEYLENFNFISNIYFSSNSDKLLRYASKYKKIKKIKRKDSLSNNNYPLINLIQNFILDEKLQDNDNLCLLLSTNILRKKKHLIEGYNLFKKNNYKKGVISVCHNEKPNELDFILKSNSLFYKEKTPKFTKKQNFNRTYYFNDAFIIDSIKNWKKPNRLLFYNRMIPYHMDYLSSIYIDYKFQLTLTSLILANSNL